MQTESTPTSKFSLAVYFVAIGGALLIVAVLINAMATKAKPAGVSAARSQERLKARKELDAAATAALNDYSWVDQNRGVVRIPIARAMEMAQQQWQNPAAARSNLLSRVEKATAPAPKVPEKPSAFE